MLSLTPGFSLPTILVPLLTPGFSARGFDSSLDCLFRASREFVGHCCILEPNVTLRHYSLKGSKRTSNGQRRKALSENVPGDFFVDSSCIDCDACRQLAPEVFADSGDASVVFHQPLRLAETRRALMALVACPTGSIGTLKPQDFRAGIDAFPMPIAENVYFCGFTAESSFGAWSYLILRPEAEGGNVLVDSPRFATQLVKRIAAMGGVRKMFLSHSDDVADHVRFAERFGCERVMHAADGAGQLGIEWIIEGEEEVQLDRDLIAIPTPGHTRGHVVLLYKKPVSVYRRSSRLVARAPDADGLSQRLLVFMGRTDTIDGKAFGLQLRMGLAGSRKNSSRQSPRTCARISNAALAG